MTGRACPMAAGTPGVVVLVAGGQDGDGVGAGWDVVEDDVSVGGLGAEGVGGAVVEGEAAVDAYLDAGAVGGDRDVAGGCGCRNPRPPWSRQL